MNGDKTVTQAAEEAASALFEAGKLASIVLEKIETWITGVFEMLPNLIVASIVVALASLIARYASRFLSRATGRATSNQQIAALVGTTSRLAILSGGIFIALGLLNLDKTVTSLLAGVGVVGLALGFAFQDIAANFMSGVIMAARKPFEIGDVVETGSHTGTIKRLTLRATVLENFSGQLIIIPNKDVLQNPIVNYVQSGERRIDFAVGVAYDTDLVEARDVATGALEKLEQRDESKSVDVFYTGFGGSSIDMSVRFWIDLAKENASYLAARSAAIVSIKQAFDEAGIEIPFPIRTLDLGAIDPELLASLRGSGDASESGSAPSVNGSASA